MEGERCVPAWLLVCAGWLCTDALLGGREAAASAPAAVHGRPGLTTRDPQRFLAHASPRELRALPGIGELRALALARERWRRGGPPPLVDVPGIGATIASRVERALSGEAER